MTRDAEEHLTGRLLFKIAQRLDVLKKEDRFRDLKQLNFQQLAFINHRLQKSCHLAACPGSGKTEVVGIKAAYEFAAWTTAFSGIAILTFTRSAASQIRERVLKYGGVTATRHPHFIGTFDAWLHAYVFQPFAHSIVGYKGREGDKTIGIVENESRAEFLNAFKTPLLGGVMPISANQYSYSVDGLPETADEEISGIINDGNNRSILETCKYKFWRAGFATYQDAEYISYKILLEKPGIARCLSKRFPFIIIDECQDLSPAQLRLLAQLQMNGTAIHFVGDLGQAIYEFRHVDPLLVEQYSQKNNFIMKRLTHNYRSNQHIVDFCQRLITGLSPVKGMGRARFSPACILFEYADSGITELPSLFRQVIDHLHLNPKRCAILARGKTTIAKMNPQDDKTRSPVELFAGALNCYYSPGRKTENLTAALDQVGRCICHLAYNGKGNHQKQYCPDEQDPISWRNLLWDLLRSASDLFPFKSGETELTWTQWAALLKSFLEAHWNLIVSPTANWDSAKRKIRAPSRQAAKKISESVGIVKQVAQVRTATIHSAKGETLQAVMLVSSPDKRSKGGHFEHWLDSTGNDEHRRFAYVACSRPQYLLIIAVRSLTPEERNRLNALGLVSLADLVASIQEAA
jgi:DNA helicase-2/ATP-dependent DNA helicase PcrA